MFLMIQHNVRSYDDWRPIFDEYSSTRKKHGQRSEIVYRSASDPNNVLYLGEWGNADEIKAFLTEPSLAGTMESAGVASDPVVIVSDKADLLGHG